MTTVEYLVMKGKTEIARQTVVIDGTAVVSSTVGRPANGAADVVFTLTPALAESLTAGTLSVGVGFMRGSIKMAGDFGALLGVLPALHRGAGLLSLDA
jgi:hypothetical protein